MLLAKPNGMSEYELLNLLKQLSRFRFINKIFKNNLALFHSHFILFHCLYKLRLNLLEQRLSLLEISSLNIQLYPFTNNSHQVNELIESDALQDYYLDAKQIDDHTENSLSEMIDSFWNILIVNDARPKALATLGVCDPVNDDQIKKAWRKLVMKNHPDRGGDSNTLQLINKAFTILIP